MKMKVIIGWLASTLAALAQGTVVVPNGLANVEGNSSTSAPFTSSSFRYQQVFGASQFTSAGFINSIFFRLDGGSSDNVLYAFDGASVTLSLTPVGPDGLSSVFANNVGASPVTIYNGAVAFGGGYTPGASPQPFGNSIIVTTPFFYNPAQGNLLLDIRGVSGTTLFPGNLDAQLTLGDSVSRVFALNNLAASGTADSLGLVTRFDMTVVPEPSTWILVLAGSATLALCRWRGRR